MLTRSWLIIFGYAQKQDHFKRFNVLFGKNLMLSTIRSFIEFLSVVENWNRGMKWNCCGLLYISFVFFDYFNTNCKLNWKKLRVVIQSISAKKCEKTQTRRRNTPPDEILFLLVINCRKRVTILIESYYDFIL